MIRVVVRNVYGNEMFYCSDTDAAAALSRLTGKKTLDEGDIDALRVLGHRVGIFKDGECTVFESTNKEGASI